MNYLDSIQKLLLLRQGIKRDVVDRLFALSTRSMAALIAFSAVVCYYLYPTLHYEILIWAAVIFAVSMLRLSMIFCFRRFEGRFEIGKWYTIFFLFTMLTALLISLLGAWFIFRVSEVEQLFIIASLLGLTGGAIGSLMPDIRIFIGYISIILIPLVFSLLSIGEEVHILFAGLLVLFYMTQLLVAYNTHQQNINMEVQQQKVIAAQEQLFKSRETMEYLFTQAPVAIFSYDTKLRITDCNKEFLRIFQMQKRRVVGLDMKLLPPKHTLTIIESALTEGVQEYVGPYISVNGAEYWVEAKSFPIHNSSNEVVGGVVLLENKTKEHDAIEKLKYLASHDTLTQLSNRRGFKEYMQWLVSEKKHQDHYSLLFYLDLNRFKYINDSLGHTFGDRLLKEVALRLQSLVEANANLTRLGGDEFVIVLPFLSADIEKAKKDAQAFAQKIHDAFEEAFIIEGIRLYAKTSIGIVLIEPNFVNVEEIVRHADISMYEAKRKGEDHISFYNNSLDNERKKIFALQQDLIHALENDGFELFLQPIVMIEDNRLNAAEALIRWRHPTRGLLCPNDFIPLAVELGIITEIGWWIFHKVCETISLWKSQGIWHLDYISINLNAKQLIKEGFVAHFFREMEAYHVDRKDIKVEITETSLIDNFELTRQVIHELQEGGIKCIIDDFGTGYSSLSYLKKLSFSAMKIDREFIFDLESNDTNETLIRTIVEIAKQFRYKVIVEGVETEEQREIIKKIDGKLCYQGFLVSKAVPLDLFVERFLQVKEETPLS